MSLWNDNAIASGPFGRMEAPLLAANLQHHELDSMPAFRKGSIGRAMVAILPSRAEARPYSSGPAFLAQAKLPERSSSVQRSR